MIKLRPYQSACVAAIYEHLRDRDDNPLAVVPTGGGKTPILATICRDAALAWNGRVVVLAHVKELLEQSAEKIRTMAPEVPMGIYSAGLGRKDLGYSVTVAGIQSVFRKALEMGKPDLIIVDECHMVPAEDEGMYRQFFSEARVANPRLRVIGLTATPYRLKSGDICGPDNILNHICYEVGVRDLIEQGYLSKLVTRGGSSKTKANLGDVHLRGGEFIASELEAAMVVDDLVRDAVADMLEQVDGRESVLIFSTGIKHGEMIKAAIKSVGHACGFVTGETPAAERAALLGDFKAKRLRFLVNVNVLTTGFDAPGVDAVVLLRPTMSPGLYYQMVGRGFRLSPGKENCLVLDYGENVMRHGPVDLLTGKPKGDGDGAAPAKQCLNESCKAIVAAGCLTCPECGMPFPEPERTKHVTKADESGIVSGDVTISDYGVLDTHYSLHRKKGNFDAPPTLRVEYKVGYAEWISEWVCIEHAGWARTRAEKWWYGRCAEPMPATVEEAVAIAQDGGLFRSRRIKVKRTAGKPFPEIVEHTLADLTTDGCSDKPEPTGMAAVRSDNFADIPEEDIPF